MERLFSSLNMEEAAFSGLSEAEAAERLKREGLNEIPSRIRRGWTSLALEVMREPMLSLLVTASLLYFFLGNLQEACLLAGSVAVVLGITIYQEHKADRALEALRDLSSPRALAIREGRARRIPGREVVRGDLVVVKEGDRIPADGALLLSSNLLVDESLLTGESAPVGKSAWDRNVLMAPPGGDDLPFVYSGSLVLRGYGIAEVLSTGMHSAMGRIGKALQALAPEKTRLQKETRRMVKIFAVIGLSLCILVALLYGFSQHSFLKGILAGVTLAMSMIPEEIPVVLTVFLALGAWRLSKRNVLTRRIPGIEALGSITVLCVDKTGTLTLNRMTLKKLFAHGSFWENPREKGEELSETFHELLEYAILASQRDPFDPMEQSIHEMGKHFLARTEHLHADWSLVREYPLSSRLLAISHVWRSPTGEDFIIAAKGAPEAMIDLCHLGRSQAEEMSRKVQSLAGEGLRVLAVAKARFQKPPLPRMQHDFDFEFLGLLGFEDPIREAVPAAMRECGSAGVRVVMMTGDYPATAWKVAREVGFKETEILDGTELASLEDEELRQRIRRVNIFARMVPEQKLRLVRAFQANGEVVAMTGDGVNDAPALKAAQVGIAMGERGTDVAREAASIVLLDDDFSSIVAGIRMGRRIFDNLKKAIAYIFAIHVPIAGMSLLPALFKWPLVFFPLHIVFLELIIDPACSIAFEAEPEEEDVMARLPRKATEPLFGARSMVFSLLQGFGVWLTVLAVYLIAFFSGKGELETRALAFTTLVIANLALIFTNRSWTHSLWASLRIPNKPLWIVVGGALSTLAVVLYLPGARNLFLFSVLHPDDLVLCLVAGIFSILWFEIAKAIAGKSFALRSG